MKKMLMSILCIFLLASCNRETIPLIGIDSEGNEVVEYVAANQFSNQSAETLNMVAKDTLTVLETHKSRSPWKMHHFQVGLLVNTAIGPAVWKFSATPGFRLIFQKK